MLTMVQLVLVLEPDRLVVVVTEMNVTIDYDEKHLMK